MTTAPVSLRREIADAEPEGGDVSILDWWTRCLSLPRRGIHETAEADQPWIVYTYGRTVDTWWPFWRSTRVLGRAAIGVECAVCGRRRTVVARLPRFGPVNPAGRKHPERVRFCLDHLHRDKPHPMAWAKPLRNLNAHAGGIDLDLLAMRLEADLNAQAGGES